MKRSVAARFLTLSVLALTFVEPHRVLAHCDGMDGPVLKAAQRALAKGDVNFVLIWAQGNDEAEIRKVFAKTPAGRDLGPAIPAADKAIEAETVEPLLRLITSESANGIRERFQKVGAAKKFNSEDVSAGREYVKAYVEFVHCVERLHEFVQGGRDQHPESAGKRPERQKGSLPWLM